MTAPSFQAFDVLAEEGSIFVDGRGVTMTMTIEAAQEFVDQIEAAIVVAMSQRLATAS